MYLLYFKREFSKKRENCGVLARFGLFLAGITIISYDEFKDKYKSQNVIFLLIFHRNKFRFVCASDKVCVSVQSFRHTFLLFAEIPPR